ncbi:MAG: hypothetical protein SFW62_09225 [Alphaproteobacteria bacterium]|nr:hypothetical protein [Alphaproteobacteria bacterium]
MDKVSLILGVLLTLALIIFMAPGIIAMNRGKILRNMALWLAIFLGLALIYKHFGPESKNPLFSLPEGMVQVKPEESAPEKTEDKKPGERDFTPPAE